jgi:hypothetical protein
MWRGCWLWVRTGIHGIYGIYGIYGIDGINGIYRIYGIDGIYGIYRRCWFNNWWSATRTRINVSVANCSKGNGRD